MSRSEEIKLRRRKAYAAKKRHAHEKVGEISCVRCGCTDDRFLQINHKEGGGGKELRRMNGGDRMINEILAGRRKVDDLELTCAPCNAIHHFERVYGLQAWIIKWCPTEDRISL